MGRIQNRRVFRIRCVEYDVVLAYHGRAVRGPAFVAVSHRCVIVELLGTLVKRLLLVIVEHLLDFLDILLVKLLIIGLPFQRAAKLLIPVLLLLEHHVFCLNRILCIHELVLVLGAAIVLAVAFARRAHILVLCHELVFQVYGAHLVTALADLILRVAVKTLVRVGHVHVLERHRVLIVHACEVI